MLFAVSYFHLAAWQKLDIFLPTEVADVGGLDHEGLQLASRCTRKIAMRAAFLML